MAFKFDIWQEGKYLDIWSIVHLISGVLLGSLLIILGIGFWSGLGIATVLLILWEIFEIVAGGDEFLRNRIVDVIIGLIGYLIAWSFYGQVKTEKHKKTALFILKILIVVSIILNIWGWGVAALR